MKLSEIFSRNTKVAETETEKIQKKYFAPYLLNRNTERLSDVEIQRHVSGCNCVKVMDGERLTVDERDQLSREVPFSDGIGTVIRDDQGRPVRRVDKNNNKIPTDSPDEYARQKSDRTTAFHKIIVDRFKNLMARGEVGKLSQLGSNPIALMDHFLRHVEAANINPNDVGISNEMYRKFRGAKASLQQNLQIRDKRRAAEQESQKVKGYAYPTEDCGVCEQYRKQFNDGILHLKDKAARDIMRSNPRGKVQGPPVSQEFAEESAAQLSKETTDAWRRGEVIERRKDNPLAYKLHGILNNWDAHHEQAHKISITNLHGPDPRVPVTIDTETQGRKPNIESVYDELLNQGSGWSKQLAPEREDPFSIENPDTGQKRDRFPRKRDSETEKNYKQRATEEAMQVMEEGSVPISQSIGDLKPKIVYQAPDEYLGTFEKTPEQKRNNPSGNYLDVYKDRGMFPAEHFIRNDAGNEGEAIPVPKGLQKKLLPGSRVKTIAEFPWGSAIGYEERNPNRQTNYMTDRDYIKTPVVYNADEDKRPLKIKSLAEVPGAPEIENTELLQGEEANIPRKDKFLFQQSGMMPDLTLVKLHNQKMIEYQQQPDVENEISHYVTRGVGALYKHVQEEITPNPSIPNLKSIITRRVPDLDEEGNQKYEKYEQYPVFKDKTKTETRRGIGIVPGTSKTTAVEYEPVQLNSENFDQLVNEGLGTLHNQQTVRAMLREHFNRVHRNSPLDANYEYNLATGQRDAIQKLDDQRAPEDKLPRTQLDEIDWESIPGFKNWKSPLRHYVTVNKPTVRIPKVYEEHELDEPARRGYARPVDQNGEPIANVGLRDYDSLLAHQSKTKMEQLEREIPDTEEKRMVIDRLQRHSEWLKKWHDVNSEEHFETESGPTGTSIINYDKSLGFFPKIKAEKYEGDKSLYDYQVEVPDLDKIPAERRMPKPEFDAEKARDRYQQSRSKAMIKLFGSDDEEAEKKLEEAHLNAFKEKGQALINSPKNKRFISKKVSDMPQYRFNSNRKEAAQSSLFFDLGQAWHGLKDVGHVLMTPVNQIRELMSPSHNIPDIERHQDAFVELMGEGYGASRLLEKGIDKYDEAVELRPSVKNKVDKARKLLHPTKWGEDEYYNKTSSVIAELSARVSATKKTCINCGKKCKDKNECKANQDQAKRDRAAENAYYND